MFKRLRLAVLVMAALLAHSKAPAASPDATQYVRWGSQVMAKGNYNDALKYFNAAAKADPKNAAAYKGMGYAMIGRGEKARAIPYLKYSAQLNPNDAQLRQYLLSQGITLPAPPAAQVASPTPMGTTNASAPGAAKESTNPWIVGGTMAALGAILLFLF